MGFAYFSSTRARKKKSNKKYGEEGKEERVLAWPRISTVCTFHA